jgi:hypothetical protein
MGCHLRQSGVLRRRHLRESILQRRDQLLVPGPEVLVDLDRLAENRLGVLHVLTDRRSKDAAAMF